MSIVDWSEPDSILSTDACLHGCGGVFGRQYFHTGCPEDIIECQLHINALELLTIVIALKLWGAQLKVHRIIVICDNQSSCAVINNGSTRSDFL